MPNYEYNELNPIYAPTPKTDYWATRWAEFDNEESDTYVDYDQRINDEDDDFYYNQTNNYQNNNKEN